MPTLPRRYHPDIEVRLISKQRLAAALIVADLNPAELARRVTAHGWDLSRQFISALRNPRRLDKNGAKAETAWRLARELGVEPSLLFIMPEDRNTPVGHLQDERTMT